MNDRKLLVQAPGHRLVGVLGCGKALESGRNQMEPATVFDQTKAQNNPADGHQPFSSWMVGGDVPASGDMDVEGLAWVARKSAEKAGAHSDETGRARDALVELDAASSALGSLMTTLDRVRSEAGVATTGAAMPLSDRTETWYRQRAARQRWEAEEALALATNQASDVLSQAQREAARTIDDANRRAAQVIAEAEQRAERWIEEVEADIQSRVRRAHQEVERLARLEAQLRDGLTAVAAWILEALPRSPGSAEPDGDPAAL